jgi:hypothetical protein
MAKKALRQAKYDKLKTDADRVEFILKELKTNQWSSLWPDWQDAYMLAPIWDAVKVSKKVFNMLKPKLERHQERETSGVNYYWELKGKFKIW